MPARFKSEYSKNYEPLGAKRPATLKARDYKDLRVQSPPMSSRPAGLMSNQTALVQEPPLQRKRIVPYAKNHNIFQTCTVKEMTDREWLNEDSSSVATEETVKERKDKKRTVYGKEFGWKTSENMTSPIINAAQRLSNTRPHSSYPYVRDGITRKTEYSTNYKKKAESEKKARRKSAPVKNKTSPAAASPEKLPPAGVPTFLYTAEDKRLLKPTDDGEYTKFKYGDPRRTVPTEYQSKYKQDKPVRRNSWHGEEMDIYNQVIERRNEAYFLASRNRGTHFSRENLENMYREAARSEIKNNTSVKKESQKKHRKSKSLGNSEPARTRSMENDYSPEKYSETASIYSDYIPVEEEIGRSPTPELAEHGQSRRHHYDVTTPAVGGALLTTPFIHPASKHGPVKDKIKKNTRHIDGLSQVSPRNSDEHSTSTRSLYDENVYSENEYEVRSRNSDKPARRSVGTSTRNEDVMSEASMSSRASVASETLERARNRRNIWIKQNKTR